MLIAVFVPITFLEGDLGRLFTEFALTIAAAVAFSALLALTLTPMMASKLLSAKPPSGPMAFLPGLIDAIFNRLRDGYAWC